MVTLDSKIQYLKGVGEARAKALAKQGIYSVYDLLRNYPRTYEDWNFVTPIRDAQINENVCFKAIVAEVPTVSKINGGRILVKTAIADGTDYIHIVFFNNKYVKDQLKENEEYLFFGKVTLNKYGAKTMLSPRFEKAGDKQRIRPIYRATSSLSSKNIERIVENALSQLGEIPEIIPQYLIKKYRLMPFSQALRAIHFPQSEGELTLAKRRLIFEELLLLQMGLLWQKTSTTGKVAPRMESQWLA